MDLNDALHYSLLYVENQGDKFHPMSDELFAVFNSEAAEERKVSEALNICKKFEGTFPYHVNRITDMLSSTEE